jgi:hypothetical protein
MLSLVDRKTYKIFGSPFFAVLVAVCCGGCIASRDSASVNYRFSDEQVKSEYPNNRNNSVDAHRIDWSKFSASNEMCAALKPLLKKDGGGAVDIYEDDYASFIRTDSRYREPAIQEKISMDELVAIRAYTHRFWKDINAALREERVDALSMLEKTILQCAVSGLNKMPGVSQSVFREVNYSAKVLDEHKVGTRHVYAAFTSTTKNESVLAKFPGNTRMLMSVITGRDVGWLSAHEEEEEVLLPPGACLEVENIEPRTCPMGFSKPCQTIVFKELEGSECQEPGEGEL